jgi:hypothetical protein
LLHANFFWGFAKLLSLIGYYAAPGRWTISMRSFLAVLLATGFAFPCSAQTILKTEPLVLAPYEIAYVQDSSCPAGKVLKVTGAIRGLHRKRECVALSSEQASLVVAVP